MPIEIAKEVEKRCKAGNLKPWESDLMKKNSLDCHGIGEAVAAIVDAKRKKESKLSLEEFYESLSHIDPDEVKVLFNAYGGGSTDKKKKRKKTFEILGKEIFAVGEWNGDKYTEKELDFMVDAFQKLDFKPFLKINHDDNKENKKVSDLRPALGFVSNLYRKGKKLIADFSSVPKKLFDAIESGAYNRVSAEIFWNLKRLDKTWPRALKAVSILGTDLPAVESLAGLNDLYEIEGKAIACYEGEDEAKIYELEVEAGKLKEFFMEPLAWEELSDKYVYPVRFKSQFFEIQEETISDGVIRFFGELISGLDGNATAGYGFDKSVFSLKKAKRWIDERRFSIEGEFKECKIVTNNEGGIKMTEKELQKLQDELEAKKTELTAKDGEVEELKTAQKASLEAAEKIEKESSDKMAELTSEKEKLEADLKKQKEDVTKFEKEKKEAEEAVRLAEIKSFLNKHKQEGRVLPRFEVQLEALLVASSSEEKTIKYTIDKKEKELSQAGALREFVEALPKMVNFAEISAGGEADTVPDGASAQYDAAVQKVVKERKITYKQASDAVRVEFPDLAEAYFDGDETDED